MVAGVADALPAGVLLVPADGVPQALYLVDMAAEGVAKAPVTSLDMTRQLCDLSFDDAPATLIASGPAAARALDAALTAGAGILAAEQIGLAQRCLDMTIAYVKERKQFARPVGSFQGLKHRLADLWVSVTQARAASRYAAACLATGTLSNPGDASVAVALAKAYCSEVAVQAAQECVQMHGGIGFTWEHPAHLYLKRAKADSIAFGTADAHRAALASLVNLPALMDEDAGPAEPGRPALARAEGPAADRRGLLGPVPRTRRWPAPGRHLRRPGRGPRRDLGRAGHLGQRPVADGAGRHLGLRPGRGDRQAAGRRGAAQGRGRAARPHGEPAPYPVRRQALRVLLRGPAAHRADRGRLRARPAGLRGSAPRSSTSSATTPRPSG